MTVTSVRAVRGNEPVPAIETDAGFVDASHPAFCLQYWPLTSPRGHVIYLPPFGEEMNRCRAIVAEQGRWFARQGLSCSILDFYGTGESKGDLVDASVAIWKQNIDELVQLLEEICRVPIILWGCRLGALVGLDYLESSGVSCESMLLWQPVPSGRAAVTQMLRQRVAAMVERGESGVTTEGLRAQLAEGISLDVGGYTIGGELIAGLDCMDISTMKNLNIGRIFWLEHSSDGEASIKPQSQRAISNLEGLSARVDVVTFTGQPLWQLHKRDSCDNLLAQTRKLAL